MHKAKACVILCMDFRFHEQIQKFLADNDYLGKCDEISIAGSSRDFIKPVDPADKDYVMKQLGLSVKLHDPDEIVIIDHQDCGGYAQDNTIPSGLEKMDDLVRHQIFLSKVKQELATKFPNRKVRFFYAALDGSVEEVEV